MRKGEEVLDALISRELIEQAIVARKLTVTAKEIDEEVDRVVGSIAGGVTREEWFRNLAKERKISPAQYKNDIIYPGLALKKLAQSILPKPRRCEVGAEALAERASSEPNPYQIAAGAESANDRLTVQAVAGDDVIEASSLAASALRLTEDGGTVKYTVVELDPAGNPSAGSTLLSFSDVL